jgi:malate permease and related proteins
LCVGASHARPRCALGNLALLVVCFLVGVLARRTRALPEDSHRAVNAWVMWVSLPALVFRSLHGAKLDGTLLASAALLWGVFAVPAAVALVLARRGAAKEPLGAVALCAGLGNTAFVGLPLIEALAGPQALPAAAVVDQLGTFLAVFLLAIPFATLLGGGTLSLGRALGRMMRAPAMVALVLAFALRDVTVGAPVDVVVGRLADMLSPLALASVGWQLDARALRGNGWRVAAGLGWKLVLAPALVLAVLLLWHGALGPTERVVVAQAAMAPMVTAGVVAAEHKLAPGLAAALISVGVPLSLLTVPLWWRLIS